MSGPLPPNERPGVPLLPFLGVLWLIVVILAEIFIELPRPAGMPANFGTATLQVPK